MNKELSPQEKILIEQSRRHSDTELLEGGAEGIRHPGSDHDQLQLSDEQLEQARLDNGARMITAEVSEAIAEELPETSDLNKFQEVLRAEDLAPKTEQELLVLIDQKFVEASNVKEAIMDIIASVAVAEQGAVNSKKMEVNSVWETLQAEVRGSKQAHPRATVEHRLAIQNKVLLHTEQALKTLTDRKREITRVLHRE